MFNIVTLLASFFAINLAFTQEPAPDAAAEVKQEVESAPSEATPAESVSQPKNAGKFEKMQVTGSYIRRTDVEGPSPVLVIDQEQIKKSGFNSVGEILRRSPVSPFGGTGSSVSLKGIGSARTLVLINGQRAPGSGSSYASGAVSTNFVPIAAVERIEILKDGASATYGSDALGGVVNIITRKDLDGVAFANKYDMTNVNGSDTNLTSVAYGTQSASSNFLTSLQFQYQQGYRSSDFDYARDLNKSLPFSTNYIDDGGNPRPGPQCSEINADGYCEEAISPKQITKPGIGLDWVTDYTYSLSSETQIYTTVIAGIGRTEGTFPNVLNTPGQSLGARFTGAETPASWDTLLNNYTGGDTKIWHRFDDYINTSIDFNYYGALILGTRGYFGDTDWQWDVTANNQININESHEENLGLLSKTRAAIIADTYNPFDPTKRDVSNLGIDAMNRNRAIVHWVEAKTNGPLGGFLGFDWSSAFGTSAAHFAYADHRNDSIVSGDAMLQSGVVGKGSRELYSVFTELSGIINKDLEVQLSARGDFYSDFGQTVNPKLAVRYQPASWLTFRSSAGTGFQAPTLQNMNAKIEGYDFLVDQVRCKDPTLGNGNPNSPDCRTQSISVFQDNNESLTEERSQSLNVGAIIQPTKHFTIAVDWWHVKVRNTIGTDLNDILLLEQRDPTLPAKYNVNVIRAGGSPTGRIERISYRLVNAGTEEVNGVDIEMQYNMPTTIGDFSFSNETTYLGHYFESFYEELGKQQVLGQFQKPRWRNNVNIGYRKGEWDAGIVARSFADTEKRVRDLGKVVSVTQIDLKLGYNPSWAGEFQFGVLNAFNIRPQFDDTYSRKISETMFQRFETFFLTYRQDF